MAAKFLMDVVKWPLNAYEQITQAEYIPALAGVGLAYYLYGFPLNTDDTQQLLMGYVVAGVVDTALSMNKGTASSAQYM